jgi:uncharacterized membrane protein
MTPTKLTAGTASIEEMSLRRLVRRARRRFARRELIALPVVLALMIPAVPALATETSGYNQKPPTPTTTTTTKTEAKKAVEPSKTTKTTTTPSPTTTVEPSKPVTTTTTPVAKASTLPFTGLDLRWVVGAGLLLLAAGLSIRLALRGRPGAGR